MQAGASSQPDVGSRPRQKTPSTLLRIPSGRLICDRDTLDGTAICELVYRAGEGCRFPGQILEHAGDTRRTTDPVVSGAGASPSAARPQSRCSGNGTQRSRRGLGRAPHASPPQALLFRLPQLWERTVSHPLSWP